MRRYCKPVNNFVDLGQFWASQTNSPIYRATCTPIYCTLFLPPRSLVNRGSIVLIIWVDALILEFLSYMFAKFSNFDDLIN